MLLFYPSHVKENIMEFIDKKVKENIWILCVISLL